MSSSSPSPFALRGNQTAIESGNEFQPKFDTDGLIGVIVTDAISGAVLMFAHMNAEALRLTLESGTAHFWSRSRKKLWKKGEESGNVLNVQNVLTDCDQDVLLVIASIAGHGVACHTGAKSCFYRQIAGKNAAGGYALENAAPHTRI